MDRVDCCFKVKCVYMCYKWHEIISVRLLEITHDHVFVKYFVLMPLYFVDT